MVSHVVPFAASVAAAGHAAMSPDAHAPTVLTFCDVSPYLPTSDATVVRPTGVAFARFDHVRRLVAPIVAGVGGSYDVPASTRRVS